VIDDDDPLPSITISDVSHARGKQRDDEFRIQRGSVESEQARRQRQLHDRGRHSHESFRLRKPAVFPPAVRAGRDAPEVPVNGDTTVEPDETFSVVLSNAVNATIGDGTGVGTIGNDDVAPTPRCPNRC